VLVSSGLHMKGIPEYSVYAGTKAAIRSFARSWAMELKDRGIRVNTLSPGMIETPIVDGQFKTKAEADGARTFFAGITPLGRIGRPEEMASAILFLASDDSSYSTGIDLVARRRHHAALTWSVFKRSGVPVCVKKTRQNKSLELGSDSIRTKLQTRNRGAR